MFLSIVGRGMPAQLLQPGRCKDLTTRRHRTVFGPVDVLYDRNIVGLRRSTVLVSLSNGTSLGGETKPCYR